MSDKHRLTRAQLQKQADDLENKWKRALADYSNLEKRVEKNRSALVDLASAQILDKFLPVLDELEICQKHLKNRGLQIVLEKFRDVLTSENIQQIEALDKEFDPQMMDAVEIVGGKKNRVVEVVLKGYRLGERILRPAKVKVGKGKAK